MKRAMGWILAVVAVAVAWGVDGLRGDNPGGAPTQRAPRYPAPQFRSQVPLAVAVLVNPLVGPVCRRGSGTWTGRARILVRTLPVQNYFQTVASRNHEPKIENFGKTCEMKAGG